jgi:hypothetical protein
MITVNGVKDEPTFATEPNIFGLELKLEETKKISDLGELKENFVVPFWLGPIKSSALSLFAMVGVVQLVVLGAFTNIANYYGRKVIESADNNSSSLALSDFPFAIMFFTFILFLSGEILMIVVSTRCMESYLKRLLFYKALGCQVMIDYKNAKYGGRKNLGTFLGAASVISVMYLLGVGATLVNSDQNQELEGFSKYVIYINVLGVLLPIAMQINNVLSPYNACDNIESTLIPLPKFFEKSPKLAAEFLGRVEFVVERTVYARLCDLLNNQKIAVYRATEEFAARYGYEIQDTFKDLYSKIEDPDRLRELCDLQDEAKNNFAISLDQLYAPNIISEGNKGKIMGRALTISKKDEKGYSYDFKDYNPRTSRNSILHGRYSILLMAHDGAVWKDPELNDLFHCHRSKRFSKFNFYSMFLYSLAALLFMITGFFALYQLLQNFATSYYTPPPSLPPPPIV